MTKIFPRPSYNDQLKASVQKLKEPKMNCIPRKKVFVKTLYTDLQRHKSFDFVLVKHLPDKESNLAKKIGPHSLHIRTVIQFFEETGNNCLCLQNQKCSSASNSKPTFLYQSPKLIYASPNAVDIMKDQVSGQNCPVLKKRKIKFK